VLVNNSGVAWGEPLEKHSEKGLDRVWALNFKAIFFLSRALLPLLDKGGSLDAPSRIINIGSIAGIRPQGFPTYGYDASKAAVHHLTRKLADELASRPGGSRCVSALCCLAC
jgi:NAD(P)-dependent dehydrogenase (short-subunit alcohol dehydrogenase family)